MEDYLRVGVISNTHGIMGEIKLFPTTDDNRRFKKLKEAYIDTGKEKIKCSVEGVKFFKNMVILKFKEYNSINDVEKFKGKDLLVDRKNAVKLEEGEYFICDLIGCKIVTDEGRDYGELTDVLQTGANDVYVVKRYDNKEILLPVIDDCILDIDIENRVIKAHIMKGLED